MRPIDGLLYLIRAEPTLCPSVLGDDDLAVAIEHRGHHEDHICLACGAPADAALVAGTKAGSRWLDVCWDHYNELASPDSERPGYERP